MLQCQDPWLRPLGSVRAGLMPLRTPFRQWLLPTTINGAYEGIHQNHQFGQSGNGDATMLPLVCFDTSRYTAQHT